MSADADRAAAAGAEATAARPAAGGAHLVVVLAAGLALAAEAALAAALWAGALDPRAALAAHLLVVALLGTLAAVQARRGGRAVPALTLLGLATVFLGPVGAAGSLLTVVFYLATYRSAPQFSDWYAALFPEDREVGERSLDQRLAAMAAKGGEEGGVAPFMAVLSYGARPQQQQAIALMTRKFYPAFAPALRQALRHPDNAIRVQAATAVATIEDDFLEQASRLEAAARARPDDPKNLLLLARHYDDYAYTGLLDPQRERQNRDLALRAYLDYLKIVAQDIEVRLAVGRLLFRGDHFAMAADWFEACFKHDLASPRMIPWYMESLYRLGRLEEVRRLARRYRDTLTRLDVFPLRVVDTARLWAAPEGNGDADRRAAA